mgnify:CR=1 FL=1
MVLSIKYNKIRESSSEYYNQLHDAGILYYSPELCAKRVNAIATNPMDWWMTEEVQKAKDVFSNKFCRVTNDLGNRLGNLINMV